MKITIETHALGYVTMPYFEPIGRDQFGVPLDESGPAEAHRLGEKYCCHSSRALKPVSPGSPLARAIIKAHFARPADISSCCIWNEWPER